MLAVDAVRLVATAELELANAVRLTAVSAMTRSATSARNDRRCMGVPLLSCPTADSQTRGQDQVAPEARSNGASRGELRQAGGHRPSPSSRFARRREPNHPAVRRAVARRPA